MRTTRYILTIVALMMCLWARGQGWNPDSPAEPSSRYRLSVKAVPAEAATTSGSGHYTVNSRVTVSATATAECWQFRGWTDSKGEAVSNWSRFDYTMSNTHETLTAHYERVATSRLTIAYDPSTVYKESTNEYKKGTIVHLEAGTYSNFTFVNWTNSAGDEVSRERKMQYTVTANDETLTAHYRFTPGSPGEPSETKPRHWVHFSAEPASAASFSQSKSFQVSEGSWFNITAYNNNNYVLKNWTQNGEVVGTANGYGAWMGTEDIRLVAHYVYQPPSPADPSTDKNHHFALYATSTSIYRGETTLMPVYMENTFGIKQLTFTLVLPDNIQTDASRIETTLRTSAYSVTASQDGQRLTVNISGGTQISESNGAVVRIPVTTLSAIEDGVYDVGFADISAINANDNAVTFSSRPGKISVVTLEEGDLQAQFSVDRYMNRAQFTNLSTDNARSFAWDFGDGTTSTERNPMHIYAEAGSYTVKLTARGVIKTAEAEQTIVINPANTWTANGDYTLDATAVGARNFTSLHEAFSLLSQCTPDGAISIRVAGAKDHTLDATDAATLALVKTLTDKLAAAKVKMTFSNEAQRKITINFSGGSNQARLQQLMALLPHLEGVNADMAINGAVILASEIGRYSSQTICSGTQTQPETFTSISTSDKVKVKWTASVAEGCQVEGYQAIGTGNLPAMTLTNKGTAKDLVTYHVEVTLDDTPIYTYIYKVYVKPVITGRKLTLGVPDNNALRNFAPVYFTWTDMGAGVEGYTIHLIRTDITADEITRHTTGSAISLEVAEGATYEWYVTAHGECGETVDSERRTLNISYLADLEVVSITVPEEVKANTDFTIKAVIRNVGRGATTNAWNDAVHYSPNADFSGIKAVAYQTHYGTVEPGGEYEVTFTVRSPEASVGTAYYNVYANVHAGERENNLSNNCMVADPVAIVDRYIADADYLALKKLWQATNGEVWIKTWKINSSAITTTGWPGVTFDTEGHVTSISLSNNNLQGELPVEGFQMGHLTSLNLSRNSLRGNVSAFCRQLPKLEKLDLSYNQISEITDLLPATITSVDLSYQNEGKSLQTIPLQAWTVGDQGAGVTLNSLLAYSHAGQHFNGRPTLRFYTVKGENYVGEMVYRDGAYRYDLGRDYRQPSGTEFVVRPQYCPAAGTRMRATLAWAKGDANADGGIDVLDAQHTLNYIMGTQSGSFNFMAADTYASNSINVQDVVATINLFIGTEESSEVMAVRMSRIKARGAAPANRLAMTDGELWIDAADNVGAIDITLKGVAATDVKLALSSMRYQMVTRNTRDGVRIVIISPTGDSMSGHRCLLRTTRPARVARVAAADTDAQPIGVEITDGTATGIDTIDADSHDRKLYDIQGRKLEQTQGHGIYIVNGKKMICK